MNRTVFGKMKVEELELWYEENKEKMSSEERSYVENVIYRKKYNVKRWQVMKKVEAKMRERLGG